MSTGYIVLKQRDVDTCLVQSERDQLDEICQTVARVRQAANEPPVDCIVVERHHPMYEAVRQIVERWNEKGSVKP